MNQTIITIIVIALVTALLRFLPFLLFRENRQTPALVSYLGQVLPYAVMGMLVVYCFKDVKFMEAPHGLPELISSSIVVLLHIWKRNTLISIGGGTLCYMVMVQVLF